MWYSGWIKEADSVLQNLQSKGAEICSFTLIRSLKFFSFPFLHPCSYPFRSSLLHMLQKPAQRFQEYLGEVQLLRPLVLYIRMSGIGPNFKRYLRVQWIVVIIGRMEARVK